MIKSILYSIIISALLGLALGSISQAQTSAVGESYQMASAGAVEGSGFDAAADARDRLVVSGSVSDAESGEPISFATVRVLGTGQSALANENGVYRLVLHGDSFQLKFTHITHYSETVTVTRTESSLTVDLTLKPALVDVGEIKVYTRNYDEAQKIILEAIRRKQDILTKLHDYSYDAYVKFVVDEQKAAGQKEIFLMTETQTTAFWEYPDKFKEVITARRQSANIEAENNLVTVGEILNFNKNRIDIGRYALVSPTAEDALDHYNYYLVDSIQTDAQLVFRLEIEPKNPNDPLFVGHIDIADSTYDVVSVDVGFSKGVDIAMLEDIRYSQRFAQFDNEYWMPVEITFSGEIEFDIPFPGIPSRLGFRHVASLHNYRFDSGLPKGTFGEYVLEVDKRADEADTVRWAAGQTIPLTDFEIAAYTRIDSLENVPRPLWKKGLLLVGAASFLLMQGVPDLFHYNRAEGAYLGLGLNIRDAIPNTDLRLKGGYAFAPKRGQFQVGATHHVWQFQKLEIGADVFHKYARRPTMLVDPSYDPSFENLTDQWDVFDYYRSRGGEAYVAAKLLDHTRLKLTYHDTRDFTAPLLEDYSLFRSKDDSVRPNPSIVEGRLRSVSAEFVFDTRKLLWIKSHEDTAYTPMYSQFSIGGEVADPDIIDNDFYYRRYWASAYTRFRAMGLGVTAVKVFAGGSDGNLPPQRYFSVTYSSSYLMDNLSFRTLNEHNWSGSRTAGFLFNHNFMRTLWVKSGIPIVEDIPFWLTAHGGMFWSDFKNHPHLPGDEYVDFAKKPYREFGFGLANLTPFLSPFNLSVDFTWQTSDYDTNDFTVGFGLTM